MLDFSETLLVIIITHIFHSLMLLVASKNVNIAVCRNVRVKNPNIKRVFSTSLPQSPFAAMSSFDSSSTFVVAHAPCKDYLVTNCNLN